MLTLGFYFLTTRRQRRRQAARTSTSTACWRSSARWRSCIVQAICSLAVIWYFHVKKAHPGNILTTGVIPALGGLGMLYVVWLLFDNI